MQYESIISISSMIPRNPEINFLINQFPGSTSSRGASSPILTRKRRRVLRIVTNGGKWRRSIGLNARGERKKRPGESGIFAIKQANFIFKKNLENSSIWPMRRIPESLNSKRTTRMKRSGSKRGKERRNWLSR